MRTSDPFMGCIRLIAAGRGSALGVALGLACLPALALDGAEPAAKASAPLSIFKNPQHALQQGLESYHAGDAKSSVEALKYAADGGQSLAQWKLARMYASGDGVPLDDRKAYDYFLRIVENFDDDTSDRRALPVISSAFVAVGVYALNGIASANMAPDPARAMDMFHFAATNFGDPNAQYNLARIYLDGAGVERDARQAARWLALAAEKGHMQAQALLGHLLFNGQEGMQRQRARGLMWLGLARDAIKDPQKDAWVRDLWEKDNAAANDADRQVAHVYASEFGRKKN